MQILSTKLYIPLARAPLVARPRLLDRLNQGLIHRLVLVSGPAGFGKTTLLSEWVQVDSRSEAYPYVAWLSLDQADNDPVRFWIYVIAALQTIREGLGETVLTVLQSTRSPVMEALLTGLINDITALGSEPLVLVLDDFHHITDPPIHEALLFLVDHLPPSMHLILSTRTDPPWPLARLRATGDMIELRTDDLRFSAAEVATFLNVVMELGLSNADITTLDDRTEGWIVGLQMAALSLQGRSDAPAFIQAFHGSHRFILDYLVEEVLDRQPDDVQDFLCQTSVLERLTSPLCDAVTGRSDSQTILTRLEQANLFLVPLDDERRWYRYHHLFADLLRSRLERSRPDLVINLHWQASAWYEEQELIVEAVMHALAARDLDRVVRLVEEHVLGLMEHGNLGILVGLLNALPIELVRSRPWLSIARAWALTYMSSHDLAEACLQNAAQALVDGQQPSLELSDRRLAPDKVAHINGHINAIRCYIQAVTHSDPHLTIELAQRALAELPESDWRARGMVAVLLGLGYRQTMNFAAAHKSLAKALAIAKATGQKYVVIDVLCQIARVEHDQGCLHQAVATCQQALRLAEEYGGFIPVVSYALSTLSIILYEWNDLAAALDFAQKALDLGRKWGSADSLSDSYYDLIMIHIANREFDRAMESIQEMKQLYIPSGLYPRVPVALEAVVRMEMNDVTGASQRVEDLIPHTDEEWRMNNLVSVYIAQFRQGVRASLEDVLSFLARTLQKIEASDATLYMIQTLAQQAIALQALGRIDEACTALRRALSMAEPEGYVRVFIGAGAPMGDLLATILTVQQGETSLRLASYVSRLLSALGGKPPVERPATPPSSVLVEPLSDREMEVLRLLNTSLLTPEIAQELYVSANTIRSHVKSIYAKLNAHGRIEALQRARELKLLP